MSSTKRTEILIHKILEKNKTQLLMELVGEQSHFKRGVKLWVVLHMDVYAIDKSTLSMTKVQRKFLNFPAKLRNIKFQLFTLMYCMS